MPVLSQTLGVWARLPLRVVYVSERGGGARAAVVGVSAPVVPFPSPFSFSLPPFFFSSFFAQRLFV